MADPNGPDDTHNALDDPAGDEERDDRRAATAIVAVLAVAVIVALAWWLLAGDEDDEPAGTTSSSTSTSTTSTSEPEATASSAPTSSPEATFAPELSDDDLATVVWPDQGSSRRFEDPVAAAHSFATDFLGFVDPVVGELRQGDQRSGEVEVRPTADGPVTTVLVRQFGEGTWWVLGSHTPDITVEAPRAGATVSNPVEVAGTARAFEGNVEVLVHEDGSDEPVGRGHVTGGGGGEAAPFRGAIDHAPGAGPWGAVVFRTTSAEDGRVWQATVVRVRLGG